MKYSDAVGALSQMNRFYLLGAINLGAPEFLSCASGSLNSGTTELQFPSAQQKQAANSCSAIAAWVTGAGQIEPIQSVGGWRQ